MMAIRISDIICFTSRWIMVCPFPPRFLNRAASFFDLWLYVLWPRQFQSHPNFSLPGKTVQHASLGLYFGVWIIVSPLPPRSETHRYLSLVPKYGCIRVLSLNWNYGMIRSLCDIKNLRLRSHSPMIYMTQDGHAIM